MTWVKIDDALPENQKVASLSIGARWSYVASICYASRSLSDGFVPRTKLSALDGNAKIAVELVGARLWEPVDGGWVIHDYLHHNRSRDAIKALKEQTAEAGRKGLEARQRNAKQNVERNAKRNVQQNAIQRNAQQNALSASASADPDPPDPFRENGYQQQQKGETLSETFSETLALWTHCTGTTVTPMVGDQIQSALEVNPAGWVADAIRETGEAGAKAWRYTAAILDRWSREGRHERDFEPVSDFSQVVS